MSKTMLCCALAALVSAAPVFSADDRPDPRTIHIASFAYGGSGCSQDTARMVLAPDAMAFTLIFDEFIAEIGPDLPLSASRKNCQLNLRLHVPHGFTYAIAAVDYRGSLDLGPGVKGLQKATYYFQGQEPQASTWRTYSGPLFLSNWHIRDEVEVAALVYAPCGVQRSLNINAQVRIDKGSNRNPPPSYMTMDSEDGNIEQIYHFAWRRCNP